MKLSLTLGKRLAFFACITAFCLIVTSVIVGFISYKAGTSSVPMMRIAAVLQDVFLFIVPALVTAILITRLPATFLAVDKKPKGLSIVIAIATMIVSIPAMNALITFNEGIHLPESMSALEAAMRQAEAAAQQSVATLLGGDTIGSLVVSVLIVGVLAGFSEELFFRGTFLRLLTTGNVNKHVAIWVVAFVFSAMHMQFYGFMPRMLLGAFFGYMMCWSGSLWLPIIMHVLNNSIYIIGEWSASGEDVSINTFGAENILAIIISTVLTVAGLYTLRKSLISKH
jgi:membrane protease YdiL (CAAX protease family)